MAQKEADAKAAMQEAAKAPSSSHMAAGSFQYQRFYENELEKKHQDKCVLDSRQQSFTADHPGRTGTSITSTDLPPSSRSRIRQILRMRWMCGVQTTI